MGAGASYADARSVSLRRQFVITKNGQVDDLSDGESEGSASGSSSTAPGASPAKDGSTRPLPERRAASGRVRRAAPGRHETALAPLEGQSGDFRTPMDRDPFDVPLSEKIDLCLRAEEGMRQPEVKVTLAMVRAQRERKTLVSSDGVAVEQELVSAVAASTPTRRPKTSRRSAATRASTPASADREAGSSSRTSASTARLLASASRPSRC